jgi:hypothetical protein
MKSCFVTSLTPITITRRRDHEIHFIDPKLWYDWLTAKRAIGNKSKIICFLSFGQDCSPRKRAAFQHQIRIEYEVQFHSPTVRPQQIWHPFPLLISKTATKRTFIQYPTPKILNWTTEKDCMQTMLNEGCPTLKCPQWVKLISTPEVRISCLLKFALHF